MPSFQQKLFISGLLLLVPVYDSDRDFFVWYFVEATDLDFTPALGILVELTVFALLHVLLFFGSS